MSAPSGWLVAGALEQLRAQLDEHAPRRSRASDGAIGDAAHASRASDHNPWVIIGAQRYVTARDFTHDPAGGLDCHSLATALAVGRDPRVKYVIWNRRIMSGAAGPEPWTWRSYFGSNPHTHHLHLSVVADLRGTIRTPWPLPGLAGSRPAVPSPTPRPRPPAPLEDDDMTPEERACLFEVRDLLKLLKPGVRLPGRSAGQKDTADDHFGWAMTAAGRADDAARTATAVLDQLTAQGRLALDLDYAALARELLAAVKGA